MRYITTSLNVCQGAVWVGGSTLSGLFVSQSWRAYGLSVSQSWIAKWILCEHLFMLTNKMNGESDCFVEDLIVWAVMADIFAVMVYGWYRMVKDGEYTNWRTSFVAACLIWISWIEVEVEVNIL
jgi:hypothetical protein